MADTFSPTFHGALVSLFGVVIFISTFLLMIPTTAGKPLCSPGYYYDQVTGNCDHCSDICEQSKEQGTVAKCHRLCPDYKEEKKKKNIECPKLQYFDVNVDRCDWCSSICQHTDDLQACKNLCPDWTQPTNYSTENPNYSTSYREGKNIPTLQSSETDNTYIFIALGVVSFIVVMGVCAFGLHKYCKSKGVAFRSACCQRRPQQPVQRETQEMESLTARGDPLSHPQDEEG